jgi:hypothetical protein
MTAPPMASVPELHREPLGPGDPQAAPASDVLVEVVDEDARPRLPHPARCEAMRHSNRWKRGG